MDNSSKHRAHRMVQFAAYRKELPDELARDVLDSSYGNKTQYSNALAEECLALEKRFKQSHLDELTYLLKLVAALPTELIKELIAKYLEK